MCLFCCCFHKNEDNDFALIFWYEWMNIARLTEIIVAMKRSRKCDTLRCTSCHCVVPRGQLGFSRSYTPLLRWLHPTGRVIIKWWHQKRRAMAFFELPVWNITTAWFRLPLYSWEIMTRKCRIILLCFL